jgi:N utilization substance protein B
MARAQERRAAIFALYQHESTARPLAEILAEVKGDFARSLALAASERQTQLDELIERHARGWPLTRMHPLERAILRVGLLEILAPECGGSRHPIPPEGAIEEAVKCAKTYCEAGAPAFINGILGAAWSEVRENGAVQEASAEQ